ncbi:MAG: hypothetical protein QGI20_13460 [Verrucomicrobiota bacterium]|nr:hypothetical protein [Verrucomicrobiota bacterium]
MNVSSLITVFKKKLYQFRPDQECTVETVRTRCKSNLESGDPTSIERGVRQRLADKVSGNMVGLWLLAVEHLRLGTWDLLCGWTGQTTERVEPRLALQMVHEAAICTSGVRSDRSVTQSGFELVNGLPFLATDTAIHDLLNTHTIQDAQKLQVALGKLRRSLNHYRADVLAVDPHRVVSHTQRHTRQHKKDSKSKPQKTSQTFWALDADTHQPVCFTTATSARTVAKATPGLLDLTSQILTPNPGQTLVVADAEHFNAEVVDDVHQRTGFDLLVPMPNQPAIRKGLESMPPEAFTRRWAGYATAKRPYQMKRGSGATYQQFVQRTGEQEDDWRFKAFLSTADRDEIDPLTSEFPKRWHVEEFFNAEQSLGWKRAGTQNMNIRYGQMTLALIAQAAIHQLRQRLGAPVSTWNADHLASQILSGLDGDVRVKHDTVVVTYYNAPNADQLRHHYEGLPDKLTNDGVNPTLPWLYNFKLDFRFR